MEAGGGREQSRPLTAEDEALKRKTDCVYFLASPLTCKKGAECEYRHSEGARVNPRDCWYWVNGNCLNPRCTFRHPPLDGLFGIPGTTSGLVPPCSELAHVPAAHGPSAYKLNTQNVPCYYFQKGRCMRGDKCSFMHGPQQTGNPVLQQVAKVSTSPDPVLTIKKDSWALKECTSQQSMHKANFDKLVEAPLAPVKLAAKSENVPSNGFAIKQTGSPYPSEDELPMLQQNNVPFSGGIVLSLPRSHQSQPMDDHLQNGREADESWRESSPGFDVLVDNNIEYFHNEGEFQRAPIQSGRNLNHVRDFDYHHPDYEPVPSLEREQYNEMGEYERYGRYRYGQEQQRISSERILERTPKHEKRMLQQEESYHDIDGSDLRHRLLKQRRISGLRSAISPDHFGKQGQRDDCSVDDKRYHAHHSRRDYQCLPLESSISSRLQGRISFPAISSPDRPTDLGSERDRDKRRHRGRSSHARLINYQGRHHDKIKRWPYGDFSDARNIGGQPIRREDADPLNFAGPKSLAALKSAKLSENFQDQKSIELGKALGHLESEGSCSFEGPKPLSVILKRKREPASGNGAIFNHGDTNNQKAMAGGNGSSVSATTEKEGNHIADCPESKDAKVDEEEEDGMTVDAMDDQELENYGQIVVESDCAAVEGGEFKPEDDENAFQEDEEDDEDDFAKKVGVMFS